MRHFLQGAAIGALIALPIILAATAGAILGSSDDLQQQQDLYCEMVAIHKDTGGEYGWPDYKHIAEMVCK